MKKLNVALLFSVVLFFAGTTFAMAQVEEEIEETIDTEIVVEEKAAPLTLEEKEARVEKTTIKKEVETTVILEGEGKARKEDVEDLDEDDDDDNKF